MKMNDKLFEVKKLEKWHKCSNDVLCNVRLTEIEAQALHFVDTVLQEAWRRAKNAK